LIGDKAYDSDPLDAELAERGIEMTSAAQIEPREGGNPRWTPAAPLPPPLEGRAVVGLAAKLPAGGDAL
jgi:hypothetical protein